MASKDLLFYSNFCDFSKEVVTQVTKKNLRHHVLLVCIDGGKYQIPSCISCVPSLLTANRDMVYVEKALHEYLEERARTLYPQHQDERIQTFSWEGNNYSESYSFVNDDMDGNMTTRAYTLLDESTDSSVTKFKDDDDALKESKFDISRYDNFLASRNRDEEHIKRSLHGTRPGL